MLKKKEGVVIPQGVNNYGMKLVEIAWERLTQTAV
jgi:hypothetical protein